MVSLPIFIILIGVLVSISNLTTVPWNIEPTGQSMATLTDDTEVTFDQVLAVGEEGSVKVGAPVVEGASVVAKVVKTGKGKKLNILTYRPKKGSMVRKGHRQPYTKVEIGKISF